MKKHLSYKEQINKLATDKNVLCDDDSTEMLIREGYFNLINGYKSPFIQEKRNYNTYT